METIIAILLLLGSFFIFIAALGLVRFKDLYSRLHSTTKASSFGVLMLIIAVALNFATVLVWVKALLIIFFIYLTAPLAAHSVANTFHNPNDKKR